MRSRSIRGRPDGVPFGRSPTAAGKSIVSSRVGALRPGGRRRRRAATSSAANSSVALALRSSARQPVAACGDGTGLAPRRPSDCARSGTWRRRPTRRRSTRRRTRPTRSRRGRPSSAHSPISTEGAPLTPSGRSARLRRDTPRRPSSSRRTLGRSSEAGRGREALAAIPRDRRALAARPDAVPRARGRGPHRRRRRRGDQGGTGGDRARSPVRVRSQRARPAPRGRRPRARSGCRLRAGRGARPAQSFDSGQSRQRTARAEGHQRARASPIRRRCGWRRTTSMRPMGWACCSGGGPAAGCRRLLRSCSGARPGHVSGEAESGRRVSAERAAERAAEAYRAVIAAAPPGSRERERGGRRCSAACVDAQYKKKAGRVSPPGLHRCNPSTALRTRTGTRSARPAARGSGSRPRTPSAAGSPGSRPSQQSSEFALLNVARVLAR